MTKQNDDDIYTDNNTGNYCAWIDGPCPFEQPWPSNYSDICDECQTDDNVF